MKKPIIFKNYINILFFITVIFLLYIIFYYYNHSTNQKELIISPKLEKPTIVKNVDLYSSDSSVENVDLPVKRNSKNSYHYTFKVKNQANGDAVYINVNSFYSSFYIFCDEELVYKNLCIDGVEGGSFDLIKLDEKYFDKELKIEFKSNLNSDRDIKVPFIMIGSKISIISYYIDESFTKIYYSLFLLITAVFLFILSFIFLKIKHSAVNIILIAFFTLNLANYIIVRSWILYYYLHSSAIIIFLEYASLITMPLPVYLLFLNALYDKKYYTWRTKLFEFSSLAILINLIVQSYLVASGQSRFVLMQKVTFALLIYSAFCIPIVLISLDKKIIKNKIYHLISILPFGILILLAFITYFKTFTVSYTPYMILATLFFLSIHLILATKKYIEYLNSSIQKDFYANLAYLDILTGLSNRNALDIKLKSIMKKRESFKNMYIFMIDMNDLKYINDTYGHYTGDEYIKGIGVILSKLEKAKHNIKAYRYAGDEFILIVYNKNNDEIKEIISFIKKHTSKFNLDTCDYKLSVAIGYSYSNKIEYRSDEFNVYNLIKRADKYMYENKVIEKGGKDEI